MPTNERDKKDRNQNLNPNQTRQGSTQASSQGQNIGQGSSTKQAGADTRTQQSGKSGMSSSDTTMQKGSGSRGQSDR